MSHRNGLDGCGKSRRPTRFRSPDRPVRSESLYRLSYRPRNKRYFDIQVHVADSFEVTVSSACEVKNYKFATVYKFL